MSVLWTAGGYEIDDAPARVDVDAVHAYLSESSYWARGRSRDAVARSVLGSLSLGVYSLEEGGALVGFARAVTDRATFAWLADVFVLDAHRGRGLGKALVRCALEHSELRAVERWLLVTRDAHDLYAAAGFAPPARPEWVMERR